MGAFTYPIFANWAWGGGWLAHARQRTSAWATATPTSPAPASCTRSAASPRWRWRIIIGPRIGKYNARRQAERDPGPRHHDGAARLLHPGVRLVRVQPRLDAGRVRRTATCASARSRSTRCSPAWPGRSARCLYMWMRYGKPDASMTRQRLAGRPGGDHRAQRLRQPDGVGHHRPHRRRARVPRRVEFVERVLKIDDPVGAISVHGTNGIWGVIAVGPVRRRQEQLRRLVERRARHRDRPVLRRRRPARGAADRRGDARRLRLHLQLRRSTWSSSAFVGHASRRRSSSKASTSRKWARSAIRTSCSSPNGAGGIESVMSSSHVVHSADTRRLRRRDAAALPAGSLAGPANGLASGAGGVHPAARTGLPGATRSRPTCGPASAWRTP